MQKKLKSIDEREIFNLNLLSNYSDRHCFSKLLIQYSSPTSSANATVNHKCEKHKSQKFQTLIIKLSSAASVLFCTMLENSLLKSNGSLKDWNMLIYDLFAQINGKRALVERSWTGSYTVSLISKCKLKKTNIKTGKFNDKWEMCNKQT